MQEFYSKRMLLKKLFGSPTLQMGDIAPSFALPDQDGKTLRLADFRGRWLVLYFYPKDNTRGCTQEACSFRDEFEGFRNLDTAVVGVSVDDVASHKAFALEHKLNFPVLADVGKDASRAYGVLTPLGFANRVTFVIDPEGKIRDILEWAQWSSYGDTVRKRVQALRSGPT